MGPPDRERAYVYRSPSGSRQAFFLFEAWSLEKQTVKARWSLIKLAPLSSRSPLIRVDPGAAHRKGPGRVLGSAELRYTRAGRQVYIFKSVRVRHWLCDINAFDTCYRIATHAGCRIRGSACCTYAFIFHACASIEHTRRHHCCNHLKRWGNILLFYKKKSTVSIAFKKLSSILISGR